MRAILLGSKKKALIHNYLKSPDTEAMIHACQVLGASIEKRENSLSIQKDLPTSHRRIDAGNSGQVYRFAMAMAALSSQTTTLTGDHSILHNRPITPLLSALEQLGARVEGLSVTGPIYPGHARLCGRDSQPVSALLMASAFLPGSTTVHVTDPGETPWIELTLHWLHKLGASISHTNYEHYHIEGFFDFEGFETTIPGDFSAAAFPLAASLITGSPLTIHNADRNDIQGDKKILDVVKEMGAKLSYEKNSIHTLPSCLRGIRIDAGGMIDALPILAVLGCFAEGRTEIVNASIARKKESDRISAIATELKKMGAQLEEREDGLIVYPSPLKGASLFSHHDHRIAMALSVAALGATGPSSIRESLCIAKSYPNFMELFL